MHNSERTPQLFSAHAKNIARRVLQFSALGFNIYSTTYNSIEDVYFMPELLMFSPFATRACIDLVVVDDEIAERRERFEFSLKRTTDLDRRITMDPSPGEIFIEDNDGINFTSSSPASVNDAVIAASVLSVVVAIAIVAVIIVIIFHRRKAKKIVLLE